MVTCIFSRWWLKYFGARVHFSQLWIFLCFAFPAWARLSVPELLQRTRSPWRFGCWCDFSIMYCKRIGLTICLHANWIDPRTFIEKVEISTWGLHPNNNYVHCLKFRFLFAILIHWIWLIVDSAWLLKFTIIFLTFISLPNEKSNLYPHFTLCWYSYAYTVFTKWFR